MILAQLVGGPYHGQKHYVERALFKVPIMPPVEVDPGQTTADPTADVTIERGRYRARLRPGGSGFDHLPNGMVPFDWEGPGGPTWHERSST